MSGLINYLQKHGYRLTVNEFVNWSGQTHTNSAFSPHNYEQIWPIFTANTVRYALGAGDREFESPHPDYLLFCTASNYKRAQIPFSSHSSQNGPNVNEFVTGCRYAWVS